MKLICRSERQYPPKKKPPKKPNKNKIRKEKKKKKCCIALIALELYFNPFYITILCSLFDSYISNFTNRRHNMTEKVLKVELSTITLTLTLTFNNSPNHDQQNLSAITGHQRDGNC
jgi:hypothetical protein